MKMIYLPIFQQKDRIKQMQEFFKGIALRFKNANQVEQSKVFSILYEAKESKGLYATSASGNESGLIPEVKKSFNIHLGLILSDSDFIDKIDPINDFTLFAPFVGRDFGDREDVFQLILSEWEADQVKKTLNDLGINTQSDNLILTDFPEDSKALSHYKDKLQSNIWSKDKVMTIIRSMSEDEREELQNFGSYTIIGFYGESLTKWKIIKQLIEVLGDDVKYKQIITTSSFEDWKMPSGAQKMYAEKVLYTYPRLSDGAKKVIDSFQKEFGYKPSVYHLLAYDGASIAIKALLEAGPGYEGIRHHLTHEQFDTVTLGKIGFNDKGKPYLIRRSDEEIFTVKYIGKKGNYENLTKLGENNDSISS